MFARILWLALAVPFWQAKPPSQWTDEELKLLLAESPWSQQALSASDLPGLQVYLASARPIADAEMELARRGKTEEPADEYRDFLEENRGKCIVLAIAFPDPKPLDDPAELKRLEGFSVLKVRRRKVKMTGHFPPTASDPWLRLVFPRAVTPADKSFRFELYLPGVASPYREVEFRVKELFYRGAPEI